MGFLNFERREAIINYEIINCYLFVNYCIILMVIFAFMNFLVFLFTYVWVIKFFYRLGRPLY